PCQLIFARCQCRHSVCRMIFVIELVREFVKDNVLSVGRISRAMFNRAPRQDQRTHSTAGLAQTAHSSLCPNMLTNLPFFFHHVYKGKTKNRKKSRKIICSGMHKQKTSLRRDSPAALIRDRKTATSFETFFGKKYLNMAK